MRSIMLTAVVAVAGLAGTAGKADAQVYFSFGSGGYYGGSGFGYGVPGSYYSPGVVQAGFLAPGYSYYPSYGYGYGARSFYSTPYYGSRRAYDGYRGGGYYGGYYSGRRYRGR